MIQELIWTLVMNITGYEIWNNLENKLLLISINFTPKTSLPVA